MNKERKEKLKKALKIRFKADEIIQNIINPDFKTKWQSPEEFRLDMFKEMKLPQGRIIKKLSHEQRLKVNEAILIAEELTQAYRELKEEREEN